MYQTLAFRRSNLSEGNSRCLISSLIEIILVTKVLRCDPK